MKSKSEQFYYFNTESYLTADAKFDESEYAEAHRIYQACLNQLNKNIAASKNASHLLSYEAFMAENDELTAKVWMQAYEANQKNDELNKAPSSDSATDKQEHLNELRGSIVLLEARMEQVNLSGDTLFDKLPTDIQDALKLKNPSHLRTELIEAACGAYEVIGDVFFDIADKTPLTPEEKTKYLKKSLNYCGKLLNLNPQNEEIQEMKININIKLGELTDKTNAYIPDSAMVNPSEDGDSETETETETETESSSGADETLEGSAQNERCSTTLRDLKLNKVNEKFLEIENKQEKQTLKECQYLQLAFEVAEQMGSDEALANAKTYFDIMDKLKGKIETLTLGLPALNEYYQSYFTNCVAVASEKEFPVTALNRIAKEFEDLGYQPKDDDFWKKTAMGAMEKLLQAETVEDEKGLTLFAEKIEAVNTFCQDHLAEVDFSENIQALNDKLKDMAIEFINKEIDQIDESSSKTSDDPFVFYDKVEEKIIQLREKADYYSVGSNDTINRLLTDTLDKHSDNLTKHMPEKLKQIAGVRTLLDSEKISANLCGISLKCCEKVIKDNLTEHFNTLDDIENLFNLLSAIQSKGESCNEKILPFLEKVSKKYQAVLVTSIEDTLEIRKKALFPTPKDLQNQAQPFVQKVKAALSAFNDAITPKLAKECAVHCAELYRATGNVELIDLMKQLIASVRAKAATEEASWVSDAKTFIEHEQAQQTETAQKRQRPSVQGNGLFEREASGRKRLRRIPPVESSDTSESNDGSLIAS